VPTFQAPEICSLYALNISPAYIRHAIRQRFERNRSVADPKILDILIAKERMEYQETINCWKMNDQFLGTFIQTDGGKPVQGTFLQKFYQGELSLARLFVSDHVERNADRMRFIREGRAGGTTSSYRNVVLSPQPIRISYIFCILSEPESAREISKCFTNGRKLLRVDSFFFGATGCISTTGTHSEEARGRGRPNGVRGPDNEELTISSLERQTRWMRRRVLTVLSGVEVSAPPRSRYRLHPLGLNFV